MAQTLSNGVVVPNQDGKEQISPTGVAEIRTLGSSVDAALASKADTAYVDSLRPSLFTRGTPPPGTDFDAWLTDEQNGLWSFSTGAAAGYKGLPEGFEGQNGILLQLGARTRVSAQMYFPYGLLSVSPLLRFVESVSTNAWTPWREVGSDALAPYARHTILQAQMMYALGPIDTGGRGVVALRVDHGMAAFKAKVLPLLRARGIKVAMAYNPRNWDYAENAGVTASDLNGWVAAGDVEIMNHSASHAAAESEEALHDQIVNGLSEIEAELPAAAGKVWGFAPPGVSTGDWMGFNDGRTAAGWGTYAGKLIMEHHAFGSGYLPGTSRRVLDGQIRDGLGHITIDGQTVASIKAAIDEVAASRSGLQLMLHPSLLDTSGKLSTAQLTEVLDYVVTRRDQGSVVTLSPYQMMVADSTSVPAVVPAWSDVTGKPLTFPSTIPAVSGLQAALDGKRNVEAVELEPGADANNYITPGVYIETYAFEATANRNFPENSDGALKVEASSNGVRVEQTWRGFVSGRRFERSRNSGVWTAWDEVVKGRDIAALQAQVNKVAYSSGVRDVASLLNPGFTAFQMRLTRIGATVTLHVVNLAYSGEETGTVSVAILPAGFRPPASAAGYTTRGQIALITNSGVLQIAGPTGSVTSVTFSYLTTDTPPTSLPGTPA